MTIGQISLILGSIALIVITYLFGPLTPSDKDDIVNMETPTAIEKFSFDQYKTAQLEKLPETQRLKYNALWQEYINTTDEQKKISLLRQIIPVLGAGDLNILAAIANKELAVLLNNEDTLMAAAARILELNYELERSGLFDFLLSNAMDCYQQVTDINPDNLEAKVDLATLYLEGTKEVMKGVSILLDVVNKDPDNISANLILGRYAVISGQYDKAVMRLEKVIQLDSTRVEAYLLLAEAYQGLGNINKAIEALETSKSVVQDPDVVLEIDNYIKKLKNS